MGFNIYTRNNTSILHIWHNDVSNTELGHHQGRWRVVSFKHEQRREQQGWNIRCLDRNFCGKAGSLLALTALNTRWGTRALVVFVLMLTRTAPTAEWMEKKHKRGCKARPTLNTAEITALTRCWIQPCSAGNTAMGNLFPHSNISKQEGLMGNHLWVNKCFWMGNKEDISSSFRNESEKSKIDLSGETEKYFAEREHLICRPAANLLNKLREVM